MDILISGASTGIGRATAVHLARLGMKVWAGVRTESAFESVRKMNVQGLEPVYLDVTDPASVRSAISTLKKSSGMLHGLVNNAGIAVAGPIEALPMSEWRKQFEVNFFGLLDLTHECLPLLRESKGRIVNMSSISGRVASAFLAPYAASKFAVEAYSDSLRREMQPLGVHVSLVEPGPIDTPIWRKSLSSNNATAKAYPPEIVELYGSAVTRFYKEMEKAELSAAPVGLVCKAVEHALTSRSPRTRYPIGRGIGFASALAGVLPDSWLDSLLRKRI